MLNPLETKAPLKGILSGILSQNYYSNLENEHNTFQLVVIRNIHVDVYKKHGT